MAKKPISPLDMANSVIKNLNKNFGKEYEDFVAEIKKAGLTEQKEIEAFLKAQGLGRAQSWILAERYLGVFEYDDGEKLLADLFAPFPKEIWDLYQSFHTQFLALGKEVHVRYSKTYVPYTNQRQFMVAKPTKKGLEIGFALPEGFEDERLQPAKNLGGGERNKHKLVITSAEDLPTAIHFAVIAWENNC